MGRCRCDPVTATGCQCSMEGSDTVNASGSGSNANPFIPTVKLDPDPLNITTESPAGILTLMPDRFIIPTMRKTYSLAGPLNLSANDPIPFDNVEYDDYSMNVNDEETEAPFDAVWRFHVFARFDNNDGSYNTIRMELDTGSGYSIYSGDRELRDADSTAETWLTFSDEFYMNAGNKAKITIGEDASSTVEVLAATFVMTFVSLVESLS